MHEPAPFERRGPSRRPAVTSGRPSAPARELTGETEYDRYCERQRRHHPLAPVPTRREYETRRTRHRETHPQSRCC
ncbi:YbdD/YjiX family protein [Streptomyces sp. NPDC050997]|uniref:YbdD/YjiX family protein n=1 Tax=Streptomyces sp. NPDC050997 TaxID=3155519 RepID=UPI003418C18E